MKTPATNTAISLLMASNMEDAAAELANEIDALCAELERVKKIALDRLERIQLKSIELEKLKAQMDDDAIERAADAPLGMGVWGADCRGEM